MAPKLLLHFFYSPCKYVRNLIANVSMEHFNVMGALVVLKGHWTSKTSSHKKKKVLRFRLIYFVE